MKNLIIGFLAGAILTLFCVVSFIEIIHIKIERINVSNSFCQFLVSSVGKVYGEYWQNYIKITYKFFAKPAKTILIYGVEKDSRILQY